MIKTVILLIIAAIIIFSLGYRLGMKRAYKECTDIVNQMAEDVKRTVNKERYGDRMRASKNEVPNNSKPDADIIDIHEWRRRRYGINGKDER